MRRRYPQHQTWRSPNTRQNMLERKQSPMLHSPICLPCCTSFESWWWGRAFQSAGDKRLWHKMWKMDVPPKVRTFLWRACSEILPTRANLARRRLPIDPRCEIYRHEEETVCHVLWECPLATNVWALVKGKL